MSFYEDKQQRKLEYFERMAVKSAKESEAKRAYSDKLSSIIPFGQPVLVGHHSEGRHRRDIERIQNNFSKSIELQKKSEYFEKKIENIKDDNIIRSDDPEALNKLTEKLKLLEIEHLRLKSLSKDKREWYTLPYSKAEIKRIKERIEHLKSISEIKEETKVINNIEIVISKEQNRIMLKYPDKPAQQVIDKLKQNGFRWSPFNKAWQRQLNNHSIWLAEDMAKGD